MKEYNIGLDVGTTSVGWAVVNTETNKIMRKGNKKLWGSSLFNEAETAEARRFARSARKRNDRRRKRIKLLQTEFKEEIIKVDNSFYQKLKESFYNEEDSVNKTIKISKEERLKYIEYAKLNPTIYHLRQKLINSTEKVDIRLVYLAIHHIIKYRGNFLYNNSEFSVSNLDIKGKLKSVLEDMYNLCDGINFDEECITDFDYEKFENTVLLDSKNDRKIEFTKIFSSTFEGNRLKEIVKLLVGDKFVITKLFDIEPDSKLSISFKGTDYEEKYNEIEEILNNEIEVLDCIKELYDMIFLKQLFKGSKETSISSLMVSRYEEHKKDLKFLKTFLKHNKKEYNKFFKNENCVYEKYVSNKLEYNDFKNEIIKSIELVIKTIESNELTERYETVEKDRIDNGKFMPRIADSENGKYPFQLNKDDLIKIIENQGKYYPFLLNKCKDTYKIVKLLEFRVPYYVGPLNDTTSSKQKNKNAWAVKRSNEIITPFNFYEVIDKNASAELFIERMISHCTYLLNEHAMPANSIMYSKFKVMNELKQIRINGIKLSQEFQKQVYNQLFLNYDKAVTNTIFKNYIKASNGFSGFGDVKITGYSSDKGFANNMKAYVDFFGQHGIFNNTKYKIDDADQIIRWITIFEDKAILEEKIRNTYFDLNDEAVKKIMTKKYKGWSSLSEKLLNTKYYLDKHTQTTKSIIDLMEETDENFMQIINNKKYNFQKFINQENKINVNKKLDYSVVENLATSPATRKGIYQTLKVIEEIIDYMGYEPKNVILEMAREEGQKKRTISRKDNIKKLYETNKKFISDYKVLIKELNDFEKIDATKLFLYFIQEGRCLYTGKRLNVNDLSNCQIDHIIPQTLIKDDSFDNKALVLSECNQSKKDNFVVPAEFRTPQQIIWWSSLRDKKLISPKKFYKLTRKDYSEDDIKGFINRQIVETRQITKHVANIINSFHKDTNVIYINSNLSHNYREKFKLYKFRDLNDFHHAHDAYLAAVLGNYRLNFVKDSVDNEKMKEIIKGFYQQKNYKELNYGYVINSLCNDALIADENGEVKFDANEFNETVKNTLYQNDVLVTHKAEIYKGALYKISRYGKNDTKGKKGVPFSDNLPTNLYGGFSNIFYSYLIIVGYEGKRKMLGIPYYLTLKKNNEAINDYIKKEIKCDCYEVIKDKIPFGIILESDNCRTRITGASIELVNDIQLKIDAKFMNIYKYAFNFALNGKKGNYYEHISGKLLRKLYPDMDVSYENIKAKISNSEIDEEVSFELFEIYKYLIKKVDKHFKLFNKEVNKISSIIEFNELSIEHKCIIIKELILLLKANATNANLEKVDSKLGSRIGRVTGKNIKNGTLIYQSPTGLRERRYEF